MLALQFRQDVAARRLRSAVSRLGGLGEGGPVASSGARLVSFFWEGCPFKPLAISGGLGPGGLGGGRCAPRETVERWFFPNAGVKSHSMPP